MTEPEVRQALRDWILRKNGKITPAQLNDQTPILEERIVPSVQILDMVLYLEHLTGKSIDVRELKKGALRNIDAIYGNFFR